MYRELLAQCAEGFENFRMELGASPEIIRQAEQAVGCRFPAELRALLTELNGDSWLFFSAQQLTERNLSTRQALGEDYDGLDRLLFFAGNGCGDYSCYRLLPDGIADPGAIYTWLHEDNELLLAAHSLEELIRRYFAGES